MGAVGRECDGKHPRGVAREGGDNRPLRNIAELHVAVIRGREQQLRVRREGETPDRHGVRCRERHMKMRE